MSQDEQRAISEYQRGYEAGLEAAARQLAETGDRWAKQSLMEIGVMRAWLAGKAELLTKEAAAIRALPRKVSNG